MTSPRQLRLAAAFGRSATGRTGSHSLAERLLYALGAHPSFADALLGDLAEERAGREEAHGPISAGWWYTREAFRSAPHLLWNALRHGGPSGRARAAAVLLGLALVPALASFALLRDAPPARLVVDGQGGGDGSEGIVLNSTHPVQLAMQALDAKGRTLPSAEVRYRWIGGMPMPVSSSGVVTCTDRGEAVLSASAGTVETMVFVRCSPVKKLLADMWIELVAGDSARELGFRAFDPEGWPVQMIAGDFRVRDSTIATLTGTSIRPVSPGHTFVTIRIGDSETITGVSVYEPVLTLEGLRPDQRHVVAPVRLARGEAIRWLLPKGMFWLSYKPGSASEPLPSLAVDGPIMCMPELGPTAGHVACLARATGTSLRIAHPGTTRRAIAGSVSLERHEEH